MIKSFRHKGLERFFKTGSKAGIQTQHARKLRLQLTALNHAIDPQDMNAPGWGLHRLTGKWLAFYAVSVDANWRLLFRFENKNAVEVNYLDYH